MKVLDGSTGEGGGQILRTALFLSTLTQESIRVENIRRGRPKPGLKAQHVGILEMLATTCGSTAEGTRLGATQIEFRPGWPRPGSYRFDVGTAGCLPLFLQTMIPVGILAGGRFELELRGGTDVRGGPTIAWLTHVLVPRLAPVCKTLSVEVVRHGFEPAGGGIVRVTIEARERVRDVASLRALVSGHLGTPHLEQGRLVAFGGESVAHESLSGRDVASRQRLGTVRPFEGQGWPAPSIRERYVAADSPGTSVTLWVEEADGSRMGADALGRRGVLAEDVGRVAALALLEDRAGGATVDRHLADHLVPWVALGMGAFRAPSPTGHLTTNVWVCQRLLGAPVVKLDGLVVRGQDVAPIARHQD